MWNCGAAKRNHSAIQQNKCVTALHARTTTSTATAAKGLKYFLEEQRRLYHLSNLSLEKQWLVLNVLLVKESKMMTVYA